MNRIDPTALLEQLNRFGTDERTIRPIMLLVERVNEILDGLDDHIDERISLAKQAELYNANFHP